MRGRNATPLVVTLATPFVEIQHADLGNRPPAIRLGVLYAMAYLVVTVLLFIWGVPRLNEFVTTVLKLMALCSVFPRWINPAYSHCCPSRPSFRYIRLLVVANTGGLLPDSVILTT